MDLRNLVLVFSALLLATVLILMHRRRQRDSARHLSAQGREKALERIERLRRQLPTAVDQQACDRIEARIKAVSRQFSTQTSIAPKKVFEMAADLIREIAAIYHPAADDPVLLASISDLLHLNERVVSRLNVKLQAFPLNTIRDVNIQRILQGKTLYDTKIKNKIEWFRKFEGLYKAGSRAWMSYNVLNPWYWGRKIAYTSVKEITYRYLLTWIITIVGEEAMTVYSQRDITTSEAAYERDLAFAMVDVALGSKHVSSNVYALILDHLLNRARLSDAVRIEIARAFTADKPKGSFTFHGTYTRAQAKHLLKKVRQVATADGSLEPETADRLARIERDLMRMREGRDDS